MATTSIGRAGSDRSSNRRQVSFSDEEIVAQVPILNEPLIEDYLNCIGYAWYSTLEVEGTSLNGQNKTPLRGAVRPP